MPALIPLLAPLLLPIANKVLDTLGGAAKNTATKLLDPAISPQNNTLNTKNKIVF